MEIQIGTYELLTVLVSFWSIKTLKVFALEVKSTLPPSNPIDRLSYEPLFGQHSGAQVHNQEFLTG